MTEPEIPHDLPDWVSWLAQDADCRWWAFEAEPNEYDHGWYENEVGRCQRLGDGSANLRWRESLRRHSAPWIVDVWAITFIPSMQLNIAAFIGLSENLFERSEFIFAPMKTRSAG